MIAAFGLYRRELGRMAAGSGAIVALPLGLAWIAWQWFYGAFDLAAVDVTDGIFKAAALVLGPLAVWLSAPALSAERAEGTSTLWVISPVRPLSVLAGKFLAGMTFLLAAALLLVVPPLVIASASEPLLWGRIAAGWLGLTLLCVLASSLTLLASALASHFSTAFVWGLGSLVVWVWGQNVLSPVKAALSQLLSGTGTAGVGGGALPSWTGGAVLYPMFVGWVDAGAVFGMLAVSLLVLLMAHQVVASERWRN